MSPPSALAFSNRLSNLYADERVAMARFLSALSEFDEQRLWDALGYPSLFDYLHRELGMSRSVAFTRMTACQLIREYPRSSTRSARGTSASRRSSSWRGSSPTRTRKK